MTTEEARRLCTITARSPEGMATLVGYVEAYYQPRDMHFDANGVTFTCTVRDYLVGELLYHLRKFPSSFQAFSHESADPDF